MQTAALLAVEPRDGDAFEGVDPLQGAAAQAFVARQLVPPRLPQTSDDDQRGLLTAQKYDADAPQDAADVISARVLGVEVSDAAPQTEQQAVDTINGERLLLMTGDVDNDATDITSRIQQLTSSIREGDTTDRFPTFLRGDTVDDPTAVPSRQSGGHARRLTVAEAAKWASPDSMLLGGLLVFVAVGLVVNRARRRQKLKMDALERDVLDGQRDNRDEGDDEPDQYIVLM
jgi:hypothetical protein